MRIRFFMLLVWMSASATVCAAAPATQPVDFLDYFLQGDDTREQWTLGGTDVREAKDPDNTPTRTLVLSKWSDPGCYEVFKVTEHQVQIRYEVVRRSEGKGEDNWIRRYREDGGEGQAPGALWSERWVTPGGKGVLSRFSQDRLVWDESKREYVIDADGSRKEMATYLSCSWAEETWGSNNRSGFALGPLLRLTSEWQQEGLMVEAYDYAKGKGLVNWRWLERIATLKPAEGEASGNVFHCEEGFVFVEREGGRPRVWTWDAGKKQKGRELDVVAFRSYWKPDLGEQWYVVFRDLSKEEKLEKKMERVRVDFRLPEWWGKPGATIADLPVVNAR